jgi:peptidyl-prolyl cis-trans isomerase C
VGWLAPGKPVHTPYGWHHIKLIETRAATAPPFDQVKAQLAANLQQDRNRKVLDDSLQNVQSR